jgi:hypothetical protein
MNKFVEHHYDMLHLFAFSETPRKSWPLWMRLYSYYLVLFVWLHQGIVHKNWENIFGVE